LIYLTESDDHGNLQFEVGCDFGNLYNLAIYRATNAVCTASTVSPSQASQRKFFYCPFSSYFRCCFFEFVVLGKLWTKEETALELYVYTKAKKGILCATYAMTFRAHFWNSLFDTKVI
jgi:hypothetical protein